MSSNYPEGSMRGSGIYAEEFTAEDFDCTNEECGKENVGVLVVTDDWGRYEINCEFCDSFYREGSLSDDRDDAMADYDPRDDWDYDEDDDDGE